MANKTISMSKVRQILKLHFNGIGKKKTAARIGVSKTTVKLYIEFFYQLKTPWEELSRLTDFELDNVFHPGQHLAPTDKLKQLHSFFPLVEKQLRRRGMTIKKQFIEYKILYPEGYGETQFYCYYKRWSKKVNLSMHIEHKAGDKVYVDFAGVTLPYVDVSTGEILKAQVFVAILGWSQYTYVEAMRNQTLEEFIVACENALHYFGGVPLAIVPDNLKSAVFKASNYEPSLNENFSAFADHYGIAILPARARKPQDKSHVENMVKITYQRIYTNLPENQTFPLEELNTEIKKHLTAHNDTVLTGKECSRTEQRVLEQSSLQCLPEKKYEMRKIKLVTVTKFGHVCLTEDQHHYSVPYDMIGKKLKMQYSRSQVNIYENYKLIASHKRIRSRHNYSTDPAHRSPEHQFVMEWTPSFFLEKSKIIDPIVEYYIGQVLIKKKYPEQAYKSCQGILSFAKRVGNDRLIKACHRAHEIGYYNYKMIEDILTKNLDKYQEEPQPSHMPSHENIRGGNYYH